MASRRREARAMTAMAQLRMKAEAAARAAKRSKARAAGSQQLVARAEAQAQAATAQMRSLVETVAGIAGRVHSEVADAVARRGIPAGSVFPASVGREYGARATQLLRAAAAASVSQDAAGLRALAMTATMDLVTAARAREALSRGARPSPRLEAPTSLVDAAERASGPLPRSGAAALAMHAAAAAMSAVDAYSSHFQRL